MASPEGRNQLHEGLPMTAVAVGRSRSIRTTLVRETGVAVLYFVTGHLAMKAAVGGSVVTPIWPPSGIALVAILAFGYRMTCGISAGSFLLNLTVGLAPGTAAVIAICNNLEYMGGAFLLRRLAGFHLSLDRRQDVIALILLAAVLATTFSAVPGVTILTATGQVVLHDFGWVFLRWWLAGMMGVLIVAPLLLVLLTHPWPRIPLERAIEAGALVALLIGVLTLIFETQIMGGRGYYPAVLAVFPFAIWAALRFGLWGATLLNLFIAGLATWETRQGVGPFVSNSPLDGLLRWGIFTNVMAITDLLLAAMAAEQRWARHALKQSHDELERRVSERTAELAQINDGLKQEMAARRHLESELLQAGERQQQAFGRELHDGVGQQLTSIAFFGATLRQRLEARSQPGADEAKRIVDLVNQTIDMVRSLARGLYPAVLESSGLSTALQQLADNTHAIKGVSCDFYAGELLETADPLVTINLYRCAQEAVNNAIRHAQARHISIVLKCVEGQYLLTVSDDGIGFEQEENTASAGADSDSGMGLRNLYYRANLLGGDLTIDSKSGHGTRITVVCPVMQS